MDIIVAARITVPDYAYFERMDEKRQLKYLREWIGEFFSDPSVKPSRRNPFADDIPTSTHYVIERAKDGK